MKSTSLSIGLLALLFAGLLILLPPLPELTGASRTVQITMSGDANLTNPAFSGTAQTLQGSNGATSIVATGNYTLTMAVVNNIPNYPTSCPPMPGSIPWQSGLIGFVQTNTPRSGDLSINYDKTSPNPGSVDSWTTTITSADGTFDYKVSFFRWSSENFATNSDGSTTVFYRGGSIEAFKQRGGRFISREQCFGQYVNYDLTAK